MESNTQLLCVGLIILIIFITFNSTETFNNKNNKCKRNGNMDLGSRGYTASEWNGEDKFGGGFADGWGGDAHGTAYNWPRNYPHLVHRGFEPNVEVTPYGYSSWKTDYQGVPLYIRFYYDDTMPAYELIWKPLYDRLKQELDNKQMPIYFVENNENISQTDGVTKMPTIFRTRNGVTEEYKGLLNYVELKNWLLSAY